ncbi:MAG: class I tRNA ligase family protein, partial [Planctomycetes bacterium]|nr:class I tRNA ligase family protein [Planctomycetota bacterium]
TVHKDLGTGAVMGTPGHVPGDYERGARHQLPIVNILNPDGTLNEEGGPFAGLTKEKARAEVVAWFEKNNLLEKVEDIVHNISLSDRSKTPIEPLVSEQWFVRMEQLAQPGISAVKSGALKFKPARWEKVYLDWLEHVQDWCISRQLWWGHRIPVWYDEDGVPAASIEDLVLGEPHPTTGKPLVRQDEDVLDTWASSWLWPFATLGWPQNTSDLERFYPTQFLSTARDIIYLWVARMVMAGYEFLDHLPEDQRCPFSTCYIHATVLDGQGRRMSKSAGNGIDPVEMIDQYGADAVRYSLMILTREGQDVKLAENRFELGQRFCNKIWNASRFVMGHLSGDIAEEGGKELEDRWIRARLAATVSEVSSALDAFDFHDAAQALYRFTWDDFCDWYLEAAKRRLRAGEGTPTDSAAAIDAAQVRRTLGDTLSTLLRLLHPFTPFMTEKLWGALPEQFRTDGLLMVADWPQPDSPDEEAESNFGQIQDAVRGFRNVRAMLEQSPNDRPQGAVVMESEDLKSVFAAAEELICSLAGLGSCEVTADGPSQSGTDVFAGGSVFLPFTADTDPARLQKTLEKKLEKIRKGVSGIEKKLGNEKFLAHADQEVVASEKDRMVQLQEEAKTLEANLEMLLQG